MQNSIILTTNIQGFKMSQRMIGATLLIAGTTIGAGMLALPMTSAQLGFTKSILLLVSLWIYMVFAALITVEISQGKGQSIAAIAKKSLGPWAKHLAGLSLLVLFWSLLSAYISGGSSIIHQELSGNPYLITFLYTSIFGICVALCTKVVDYTNRILFIIKCIVFAIMILGLFPLIQMLNLTSSQENVSLGLSQAIPIFFTSFGFHGSLPSLIQYLNGDKKKIYFSIFVGSFIPLVVYILWQAVTLGVLGTNFSFNGDVALFISALTAKTEKSYLSFLADTFAFLAISTSFLGVALGLFDYISEWFAKEEGIKKTKVDKLKVACLTFALPFLFALFYPKGFVFALGFAAISLSLLAVVLPTFIAIRAKSLSSPLLRKSFLFFMLFSGLLIIGIEVFTKFNY